CGIFRNREQEYVEGQRYEAGSMRPSGEAYGAVRALDPQSGERRWEYRTEKPSFAGVMTTATGLLFSGDMDGRFFALDSRSGTSLWEYQMGSPIYASAITYMLDGRQHVLIGAGVTLTAFAVKD